MSNDPFSLDMFGNIIGIGIAAIQPPTAIHQFQHVAIQKRSQFFCRNHGGGRVCHAFFLSHLGVKRREWSGRIVAWYLALNRIRRHLMFQNQGVDLRPPPSLKALP